MGVENFGESDLGARRLGCDIVTVIVTVRYRSVTASGGAGARRQPAG